MEQLATIIADGDMITCGCCGKGILNTPAENTHYGISPYPDDTGFGMCVECGGDKTIVPDAQTHIYTEAQVRKKLGWAGCAFYDTRIELLQNKLTETNKTKFNAMSFERKVLIIAKMVERGAMI